MKFLADENVPGSLIRCIKKHNYDIETVHQNDLSGSPDADIFQFAKMHDRIIITFDKDFLVRETQMTGNVVLLRFPHMKPKEIIPYIEALLPRLKSRKNPFTLILSREGIQRMEE